MTVSEYPQYFKAHFKLTSSFFYGLLMMVVDACMLMISIGAGFFIVNFINTSWIIFKSFVTYSIYLPLILAVFFAASLYPGILLAPQEEVKRFSLCTGFALLGIALSINVEEAGDRWPIAVALTIAWPVASLLLPIGRETAKHIFSRFSHWGVPVVVYSKGANAVPILDRLLSRKHYGYKPALIITNAKGSALYAESHYKGIPVFTQSEELHSLIKRLNIKVAIVCDYPNERETIQMLYRYIISVPQNQLSLSMSLHMRDFGGILAFSTTNFLTRKGSLVFKRLIDITLCLIALPFVLLISLFICIAIKIDSPGPVIYGHKRIGKNRKELTCYKFRSMCNNADEVLQEILATDPVRKKEWEKDRKFTDDPRVTKVGKFLRKTSLDELPQLWNIFLGEMSFVGPRPVTEPELHYYGKYADYVLSVTPGLSGMWQISGRSDTGYEERVTLDTYYIQNWSIWLDVWIIIKTAWVVFLGKGAY